MVPQSTVVADSIAEMLLNEGNCNMFVQGLQQSGLIELVSGQGTYTVFAPTDSAFLQYTSKTIQELMGEPEELKALLSYHIVTGNYSSSDLEKGKSLQSISGQEFSLNAKVIEPDIECSNGILHVIDSVLIPR